MPFHRTGSIRYFRFENFEDQPLKHAIFTRHGGYSPAPWHSLNFGASVGDSLERVTHNRQAALESIELDPQTVFDLHQVHSTTIVVTDAPLPSGQEHIRADALLTNTRGITLMMRFADCVPIMLYDPEQHVIGLVHAGWIGTVDQIARKTILKMMERFHSNPSNILAGIGPSIGPDHYFVKEDVVERVKSSFGISALQFLTQNNEKTYFNLWLANQWLLTDMGVKQIEVSGICTQCNLEDWYSHRGDHGRTGRFGAVISLPV